MSPRAPKAKPRTRPKARPKARPKPKPVPKTFDSAFASLAVGHHPAVALSPETERVFRAFQSNLLSLLSHELRTPLTGVLNALKILESGDLSGGFTAAELIKMARRNASQLQQTLLTLLDLAALEGGGLGARLREVDLSRLVMGRLEQALSDLGDREVQVKAEQQKEASPTLGDPQRLARVVELLLQMVAKRAKHGSRLDVRISSAQLELEFELGPGLQELWNDAWLQGLAGFRGGVLSPVSAFSQALQSEEAFLTRKDEGLGSEFPLIHEILRMHRGQLTQALHGTRVALKVTLPQPTNQEALTEVLSSRAYHVTSEIGSVGLLLLRWPESAPGPEFEAQVKANLFRTSDAVYRLDGRKLLAVVLDDCRPEDAKHLVSRLEERLPLRLGKGLVSAAAHCPTDGHDPRGLLQIAEKRLAQRPKV